MPLIRLASGAAFAAEPEESILDAAARAGIALEYSCRSGRCSTCRGQVLAGETRPLHDESGLTPEERAAGWILTCVRSALSDVSLEAAELGPDRPPAPRIVPCRIAEIEAVSETVRRIALRLPPDAAFAFRPGQYVDVIGRGGLSRSYSIANAPRADGRLELLIRRVEGGAMSAYWFEQARVGDLLRLNGPLGTFYLRDAARRRVALLATGTGIAPVKAICEGLEALPPGDRPASVLVCWGDRTASDLYWRPGAAPVPLEFVPVVSRPDESWRGERGYVQHAVARRLGEGLHEWLVYACGSEAMIADARALLTGRGLPAAGFHADAFVASGPT